MDFVMKQALGGKYGRHVGGGSHRPFPLGIRRDGPLGASGGAVTGRTIWWLQRDMPARFVIPKQSAGRI